MRLGGSGSSGRRMRLTPQRLALDAHISFDPYGYAAERLATIRSLIEESGLYRVRTPEGDLWRWKEEPRQPRVLEWKS